MTLAGASIAKLGAMPAAAFFSYAAARPSVLPAWLSFAGVCLTVIGTVITAFIARGNRQATYQVSEQVDAAHARLLHERDTARRRVLELEKELRDRERRLHRGHGQRKDDTQ